MIRCRNTGGSNWQQQERASIFLGASISLASPFLCVSILCKLFGCLWCQGWSGISVALVSALLWYQHLSRVSVIPMLLHILRTALKRRDVYSKALRISRCFSSLCLFGEVIRVLCSHHAFVQSGSYAFIVPFMRSPRRRSGPG